MKLVIVVVVISVIFICSELYDIADEINKMTRILKELFEEDK
jgi:Sec-independent protein translocase protein TatA